MQAFSGTLPGLWHPAVMSNHTKPLQVAVPLAPPTQRNPARAGRIRLWRACVSDASACLTPQIHPAFQYGVSAPREGPNGFEIAAAKQFNVGEVVCIGPRDPVKMSTLSPLLGSQDLPHDAYLTFHSGRNFFDEHAVFKWGLRATGGGTKEPPASELPRWYFCDHSSEPNLRWELHPIWEPHYTKSKKTVPVLVATRPIQTGDKLTFHYALHPRSWCNIKGCTGCFDEAPEYLYDTAAVAAALAEAPVGEIVEPVMHFDAGEVLSAIVAEDFSVDVELLGPEDILFMMDMVELPFSALANYGR